MKISKIVIVNNAGFIASLNVAIGDKGLELYKFIEAVAAISEPFEKFRTKLIKDLGIEGKSANEAPEKFEEFAKGLSEYLAGDVELSSNFLTEEEFALALKPLLREGGYIEAINIKYLKDILVKKEEEKKPVEHKSKSKRNS